MPRAGKMCGRRFSNFDLMPINKAAQLLIKHGEVTQAGLSENNRCIKSLPKKAA
jgi:hypothetical protein